MVEEGGDTPLLELLPCTQPVKSCVSTHGKGERGDKKKKQFFQRKRKREKTQNKSENK